MKKILSIVIVAGLVMSGCNTREETKKQQKQGHEYKEVKIQHADVSYSFLPVKKMKADSFKQKYSDAQRYLLFTLNRTDMDNILKGDSIIVPSDMDKDVMQYSIFPYNLPAAKDIKKIIFFSYPAQAYGAYEYGNLVRWGATNMGRQDAQTPTGLFFANWKAEETHSTVDDEWILKWNFNIANKEGVGWHQYAMPGYPASHSCLRLFEKDARYLYDWADQWIQKNETTLEAQGTPVIVFGNYPFGGAKPWHALVQNPKALDISAEVLEGEIKPHLDKILAEQDKRDSVVSAKGGQK